MKKIISLILTLITLPLCFGCSGKTNYISAKYFNTDVYVQVNDGVILDDLRKEITSFLSDLEKEFSVGDINSQISRFNQSENEKIKLSKDGVNIVEKAISCYELFNNKFNPALYPLSVLWKFSPNFPVENFTPPTSEQLKTLSASSLNFNNFVLDKEDSTISKLDKDLKVDFGGIVKGYASQKIGEMLKNKGYRSGYVSIGYSSLYVINADSVGIKHPEDKTKLAVNLITKNISNFTVSTSGWYERFYEHNGKTYGHIIDGNTLEPANTGVVSATVILDDGTISDALSTALCLYSHNPLDTEKSQLIAFIRELLSNKQFEKAEFYLLFNDGEYRQLITNKNQGENFTLTDINYQIVKV